MHEMFKVLQGAVIESVTEIDRDNSRTLIRVDSKPENLYYIGAGVRVDVGEVVRIEPGNVHGKAQEITKLEIFRDGKTVFSVRPGVWINRSPGLQPMPGYPY